MSQMSVDGFFTTKDPARAIDPTMLAALDNNQQRVLRNVNTRVNTLMHGPAGSGKSRTIEALTAMLQQQSVAYAITAPTGVAAINIGGSTIHSLFSGLGLMKGTAKELFKKLKRNSLTISRIRSLEVLVIDEISMVAADFLDLIDNLLRLSRGNTRPFGGICLVFSGDFYQLPPVDKSPDGREFAFEADCWEELALN
jgi:ATP-dependent DNA helicase PIF1